MGVVISLSKLECLWGLSKRRRDDGTGDGTFAIDCPGKDYRIATLSKVNNIIYCKNDVLA